MLEKIICDGALVVLLLFSVFIILFEASFLIFFSFKKAFFQ